MNTPCSAISYLADLHAVPSLLNVFYTTTITVTILCTLYSGSFMIRLNYPSHTELTLTLPRKQLRYSVKPGAITLSQLQSPKIINVTVIDCTNLIINYTLQHIHKKDQIINDKHFLLI